MKTKTIPLIALALLVPALAGAQSSTFGVRGLGIQLRPMSPWALAASGGFGMFERASHLNPAAIATAGPLTATFSITQNFRSSEGPVGTLSGRDNRFPFLGVSGKIRGSAIAVALSFAALHDRSYSVATLDTLVLRGEPVLSYDTVVSQGGLSDLRFGMSWEPGKAVAFGAAFHVISGGQQLTSHRTFGDSSYAATTSRSEVSYLGAGVSLGTTLRLGNDFMLAASIRTDSRLNVDRDTLRIARTELPMSGGAGMRLRLSERLSWGSGFYYRKWSVADSDIRAQGGVGAQDAYDISSGFELLAGGAKKRDGRIFRVGGLYATLPFELQAGQQPHEWGLSAGGLFSFARDAAAFSLTLQQLFRSDGAGFSERSTVFSLGLLIRPRG